MRAWLLIICFVFLVLTQGCKSSGNNELLIPITDTLAKEKGTPAPPPIDTTLWEDITDRAFKKEQLRYARVRTAYKEATRAVKHMLLAKGITSFDINIYIRAFKQDELVEVWAKGVADDTYQMITTYKSCYPSGVVGPKRARGDLQVPEGFYHIDRFNPFSRYYLSLGINYPNRSDRMLGERDPGGNIFIHGDCVSIGCIAITDEFIMQLYALCVEAKSSGPSKIPVHIFPTRMKGEAYESLKERYAYEEGLITFWKNIQPGYDYFEKCHQLPKITIDEKGKYLFKSSCD